MSQHNQHDKAAAGLSWRAVGILALAHAALFTLSFHPWVLFPLAFVCLVPLGRLLQRASWHQAWLGCGVATAIGGGAAVFWLSLFGVAPWFATALGFGLYGTLFALLAWPLARRCSPLVWLPLCWVACEALRGWLFFWAFPWFYLAHAVYPISPLIQVADLGGQLLVSVLVALFSAVALELWTQVEGVGVGRRWLTTKRTLFSVAKWPVLAFALAVGYGLLRPSQLELRTGPQIALVQPNFPQSLKNATQFSASERLSRLVRLTETVPSGTRVIVWPETMLPVYRADAGSNLPYQAVDQAVGLQRTFAHLAGVTGAEHFLVGSLHAELRDGEPVEHNAAFYLDKQGSVRARYDKIYLAPISEHTPLQEAWPAFYNYVRTELTPGFSQFERGAGAVLIEVDGALLAPNVCFDVTFPQVGRMAAKAGAQVLVNLSNYAWFEDSAELDLAWVHGIFRAIETRRSVVASVNGGIAHMATPTGELHLIEPVGGRRKQVAGVLSVAPPLCDTESIYVRYGEWFGSLVVTFSLIGTLWGWICVLWRRHRPVTIPS